MIEKQIKLQRREREGVKGRDKVGGRREEEIVRGTQRGLERKECGKEGERLKGRDRGRREMEKGNLLCA